jgi:sortase A
VAETPRPAVVRTSRAAAPRPPVAGGRVNLGGDHHRIVPQEPFGTIEIPKIGLVHPIYQGIDLPNIHWGPGHWQGSAMPGQVGNAYFAGHRVTHTRPFLDIDKLEPGDQIIITTDAGRFVYEVTGHEIVTPDQVRIAKPTPTATLTLSACHPKGSASRRYVVYARLIG